MEQWIDNTRKRQETLKMANITDRQTLTDHINQQKACFSMFTETIVTNVRRWFSI